MLPIVTIYSSTMDPMGMIDENPPSSNSLISVQLRSKTKHDAWSSHHSVASKTHSRSTFRLSFQGRGLLSNVVMISNEYIPI